MFDSFAKVNKTVEFEMLENGFVLRVNGRDANDNWLNRAWIFNDEHTFFDAITALVDVEKED
jgi:hypothetical protein